MFLIDEDKFVKLPDNGKTRYGGGVFFAWKCNDCGSPFKAVFKSVGESEEIFTNFAEWQKTHTCEKPQ